MKDILRVAFVVTLLIAIIALSGLESQGLRKSEYREGHNSNTAVSSTHYLTGPKEHSVDQSKTASLRETYGRLPLYFIENRGQLDDDVIYYERGSGHSVFFTKKEAVFSLKRHTGEIRSERLHSKSPLPYPDDSKNERPSVLRMEPLGMNKDVEVVAGDLQQGIVSCFTGNDPSSWKTGISTYRSVSYKEAYPGIDIKFYGNNRQLEYDIIIKPWGDPSRVQIGYRGVESLEVGVEGELLIQFKQGGTLVQRRPLVYQEIGGHQVKREGSFTVKKEGWSDPKHDAVNMEPPLWICGFEVKEYDRQYALVIDPVLVYSTYLGGSGDDAGYNIAIDSAGNIYVAGTTVSSDFPTNGALDASLDGYSDAFVSKFNTSGTALIYSTYLGGSGTDNAKRVAVDADGNAFIAGETFSVDFPTNNALDTSLDGYSDAFVTKLNESGTTIIYSTYLGGSGGEGGYGLDIDMYGNALVTGYTNSSNFPTANAFDSSLGGGFDAFVTKLNASGTALLYSTYLGGSNWDWASAIAVDSLGNAYVTGETLSSDFPTISPFQGGLSGTQDAFITKLNASGEAIIYSTFLGGTGLDYGYSIAVDSSGSAYITGKTKSSDFPTNNALYPFFQGGDSDAFVTKLTASGDALVYSTYLGGGGADYGSSMAVDGFGNAYIIGDTGSSDFPAINSLQGGLSGTQDAFITKFNASGETITYSTFLGGSGVDYGNGIAIDSLGHVYVTGTTYSSDFPLANPFDSSLGAPSDAFVSKLEDSSSLPLAIIAGITRYYETILDRPPDAGGLNYWLGEIGRLQQLGIDIREGFIALAKLFFTSLEYSLQDKSDQEFVTDLYQTFFNRLPDPGGLAFWLDFLSQGLTRPMLITQFGISEEFAAYMQSVFGAWETRPENNLLNDLYRGILNRFPDDGGFAYWLARMRLAQCSGPLEIRALCHEIALAFVQSAEYALRERDNQEHIEDLYNAILRRSADPGGFGYWVTLLDDGTLTREEVLQYFADSPEFQMRVDEVIAAGCFN